MTNGDKIRAMSNEELAIAIDDKVGCRCEFCGALANNERCSCLACVDGIMLWLNKEAES